MTARSMLAMASDVALPADDVADYGNPNARVCGGLGARGVLRRLLGGWWRYT
jgi:hypothetical protein